MILIVAPEGDLHAICVAKHLSDIGASVRILDIGEFAHSGKMCLGLAAGRPDQVVIQFSSGNDLDLSEVSTVWYRRPRLPSLANVFPFEADRVFAVAEWNAAIDGIMGCLETRFVNDPIRQRSASKPRQLKAAKKAGLAIPDTLITSSAQQAEGFVARHCGRVIHKPLTAPLDRFLATKRWDATDAAVLQNLHLAPTIFQEEIQGSRDLRVTVIGDKLFSVEFPTTTLDNAGSIWIDNRLNLDVSYSEHLLSPRTERALIDLMNDLGLLFGTIDLKIDEKGNYVFLEVNPQGQFLYIEILTGLALGRSMAEFLFRH